MEAKLFRATTAVRFGGEQLEAGGLLTAIVTEYLRALVDNQLLEPLPFDTKKTSQLTSAMDRPRDDLATCGVVAIDVDKLAEP